MGENNKEETKILKEEMQEALAETETEEIIDAKIQHGLNEAAEEFKTEMKLENAKQEIREPEPPVQEPAGSERSRGYTMEGNRTMEENAKRESVEVKTVYVREKKRTGWWKIVMMVLAILIMITFAINALFTGLGVWQLKKIADKQEEFQVPAPGQMVPYNYDGSYSQNNGNGFGLDDLLEYFGYGTQKEDTNDNYGDNNSSFTIPDQNQNEDPISGYEEIGRDDDGQSIGDTITDWFEGLFGGDDGGVSEGQDYYPGF